MQQHVQVQEHRAQPVTGSDCCSIMDKTLRTKKL